MKRKKEHHEEHVDETWLLPYSDMLTLLLALFIVMFAMSQVDNKKLARVSQTFNAIFAGGKGVLVESGGDTPGTAEVTNSIMEQDKMADIKAALDEEIKSNGYDNQVKVNLGAEGLSINIQDTVLFNSGEADVIEKFNPVLLQISSMIKDLDNEIRISGHTDNIPIKNAKFRSNWDLSYMRASNVMEFFVNRGNVAPEKFSIEADGEYRPKYDNSTAEGRAKNRSIDILVVRKYALNDKKSE
ncbi:flagellar motor protein MotB [Clostridium sp. 'White wine YQ']|uniref:flagellar motor protein MotB n=1 Tax=Clostridium sp. 'White wine YQ' TaxID=3027474 RepID=UPI002365ED25|nr:flagellar motor protein MotB [Clostridium sp. 'White wine YQ']MDD7794258.1 flagellar motor protein MotB [Clostridium sp. 'White wine YQ']